MDFPYVFDVLPDNPDRRDVRFTPGTCVIPEKVDLRGRLMPPVYDQKNLGSCVGQAMGALLQYTDRKVDRVNVMRSRLWIYQQARKYLMRDIAKEWRPLFEMMDTGCRIRDAFKAVAKFGCPPETLWPYRIERFHDEPPGNLYPIAAQDKLKSYQRLDNTEEHLCTALAQGQPVVLGINVYEGLRNELCAQTGTGVMPKPYEQLLGGHAVMLVGYNLYRREWLVRNSWGKQWGQAGYFTLPWEFLLSRELTNDIWTAARY